MLISSDGRFFYQSSSVGLSSVTDTINVGQLSVVGNTVTGTQESAEWYGHGQGFGLNISGGFSSAPISGVVAQNATISFAGSTWAYDTSGLYSKPSSQADEFRVYTKGTVDSLAKEHRVLTRALMPPVLRESVSKL